MNDDIRDDAVIEIASHIMRSFRYDIKSALQMNEQYKKGRMKSLKLEAEKGIISSILSCTGTTFEVIVKSVEEDLNNAAKGKSKSNKNNKTKT